MLGILGRLRVKYSSESNKLRSTGNEISYLTQKQFARRAAGNVCRFLRYRTFITLFLNINCATHCKLPSGIEDEASDQKFSIVNLQLFTTSSTSVLQEDSLTGGFTEAGCFRSN